MVANVNKPKSVPVIVTRANKATKKIKVDNLLAKDTPKKAVKAKQTKLGRTDKQVNVQGQPGTSLQRSPVTYPAGAAFNVMRARRQAENNSIGNARFHENQQTFSMMVDADEDTFGHTDEDNDSEINFKEGNDTLPDLEQDSEQSSEMGDNNDSVKMMPITKEDRVRQMEEIDNEMTEKLSELRDIMAQGGLQKSTQFINENMLNLVPQNTRPSAPVNSRNLKTTAAHNDGVPGKHLNMSGNCNKVN